jgi:hypothetical protein
MTFVLFAVFYIKLSCNRTQDSPMNEANVQIVFKIGLSPRVNITMVLKRKKICLRSELPPPPPPPPPTLTQLSSSASPSLTSADVLGSDPMPPSIAGLSPQLHQLYTPLYVFLTFTACFTVFTVLLFLACYIRIQKSQQDQQYM